MTVKGGTKGERVDYRTGRGSNTCSIVATCGKLIELYDSYSDHGLLTERLQVLHAHQHRPLPCCLAV